MVSADHQNNAMVPCLEPRHRTIVVAHDDEVRRSELSRILAEGGFDVLTASTGVEALTKIRAGHASLVIAGVSMQDTDGLELLRAVSQIPGAPPVIIVASTGADIERVYLRIASLLGAARTYELPLSSSVLLCDVRELIDHP